MTPRAIEVSAILPLTEYVKVRAERRRQIAEIKKNRRLEVGPFATFYFESYETMLHQVHEMLFIEKGGPAQIPDELAAYNPLIPQGSELVATVMFEIDDPIRRARVLAMLGGVENQAFIRVGSEMVRGVPEGDQALAQITLYLAVAPKSDAAYRALNAARATVAKIPALPVPMQLRNAPTKPMKECDYGAEYQHAHTFEDAMNTMECLPDNLRGTEFYQPTERGIEQRISQRLAEIRARRKAGP